MKSWIAKAPPTDAWTIHPQYEIEILVLHSGILLGSSVFKSHGGDNLTTCKFTALPVLESKPLLHGEGYPAPPPPGIHQLRDEREVEHLLEHDGSNDLGRLRVLVLIH